MKTKMMKMSWLLVVALVLMSWVANAQQNQNPTQTVCLGDQPYTVDPIVGATFTWTLAAGGTITSGQGTNSIVVNWNLVGGPYTLSVYATLNGCDGLPQSVDVTVIPAPVGPTLLAKTPDVASVCAGTLVSATFNPGSGGLNCTDEFEYSYDGSGTWVAYTEATPIVTTGHTLVEIRGRRSCDATLGCGATEWVVLASWIVTDALPVVATITADPNPVCEGSEITFTATGTNIGSTPGYAWYLNGILVDEATGSTYTYTPVNGDIVYCIISSSEPCAQPNPAQSNSITVIVNPRPVTSGIWHN
jgi:hypothetical protein